MPDIRPYGVAIHQAVVSGDLVRMKQTLVTAEQYLAELGDVSSTIRSLKVELPK
jgi:hypothetical protein